jgi:hypothetical protein
MFLSSLPPLPGGELPEESASNDEAPKITTRQDRDKIEEATERTHSTSVSTPSASSKGAKKQMKGERILLGDQRGGE